MMSGAGMGLFWIWPVLVVIGLAVLGYLAYRLTQNRRPGPGTGAPADQTAGPTAGPTSARILDERYARGEIDEQDYHRRRDELP